MTHACPQGIKLLQAVIVSLFHKVGIFNDVQTLFLYMLVCHSWTQHLLCILMSAELLSALLGLIGQFCRAPWGKWQHGEEAAERGGQADRENSPETRCVWFVKVIVSTYGLTWIQVLSWSALWLSLSFTTACWQLNMDVLFVCKCSSGTVMALNPATRVKQVFKLQWKQKLFEANVATFFRNQFSSQVWYAALVPSRLLCATSAVFPVGPLIGQINKDSFVEGKTSVEPKKALFLRSSLQYWLAHRSFGPWLCGLWYGGVYNRRIRQKKSSIVV